MQTTLIWLSINASNASEPKESPDAASAQEKATASTQIVAARRSQKISGERWGMAQREDKWSEQYIRSQLRRDKESQLTVAPKCGNRVDTSHCAATLESSVQDAAVSAGRAERTWGWLIVFR